MPKYSTGAFCFTKTLSTLRPMTPLEIETLAAKHGIPLRIVPEYAGDCAVVLRAISSPTQRRTREGWLVRPIIREQHKLVFGIVQERRDKEQETLDLTHEYTLDWSDEHGNGNHVSGGGAVVQDIDALYQELRGKVAAPDWTHVLTRYLLDDCKAQPMREDGRVYWVPPQELDRLRQLRGFLGDVGIAVVLAEVEAENTVVVQQAAQEGLAEQLQALQDEAARFDGEQLPGTYKARLETYKRLRAKAMTYQAALGIGIEQAQHVLASLEASVQQMLTLREGVTLPRKGTADPVAYLMNLAAQGEDALAGAVEQGDIEVTW